jgi:hypothetical protein
MENNIKISRDINKYYDVIRKRYAKFIGKEDDWQSVTPKI